jgi:hypothetical protein
MDRIGWAEEPCDRAANEDSHPVGFKVWDRNWDIVDGGEKRRVGA